MCKSAWTMFGVPQKGRGRGFQIWSTHGWSLCRGHRNDTEGASVWKLSGQPARHRCWFGVCRASDAKPDPVTSQLTANDLTIGYSPTSTKVSHLSQKSLSAMTLTASPSWNWILGGTAIIRPMSSALMALTSLWGSLCFPSSSCRSVKRYQQVIGMLGSGLAYCPAPLDVVFEV